jgi:hypothetical protein
LKSENGKWEVVVWHSLKVGVRDTFATKEEAYEHANRVPGAYAVEVYGPDGEYDAA